jgi:hypothetical protein
MSAEESTTQKPILPNSASSMQESTTSEPDKKYIFISGIDRHSSVFTFKPYDELIINEQSGLAKDIKLGDTITFDHFCEYYRNETNTKTYTILVKYIGDGNFLLSCFLGECLVSIPGGETEVNKLAVGDTIITADGSERTIKCILKTYVDATVDMCIHKEGLIITPFHPVKINSKWVFPNEVDAFKHDKMYVNSVYSIGLVDGESLMINGVEVIGLGHNIKNDSVASHDFFGTDAVITDILQIAPDGYCSICPNQISRSKDTGLIDGICIKNM